ncbi:32620_t:CDS:2, partial [Racocetra persica]
MVDLLSRISIAGKRGPGAGTAGSLAGSPGPFHSLLSSPDVGSWANSVPVNCPRGEYNSFFEEGKGCYAAEEMPKILSEYRECLENNDWS